MSVLKYGRGRQNEWGEWAGEKREKEKGEV
jgi:hypothetical protein